jgi:cytidine deaminase
VSKKESFKIEYQLFNTVEDLSFADRELLEKAQAACYRAYAPYSKFRVGAAVRLENEVVFVGANQENAAYPLGSCAEHVAINAANVVHPETPIIAVAITVKSEKLSIDEPIMPCGGCRQVLCESERRFKNPIRLILMGETGKIAIFDKAHDLLPFAFELDVLNDH